jgi:heptosyltransferase-1
MLYTRKLATNGRHVVEQNAEIAQTVIEQKLAIPDVVLPCDPKAEGLVSRRLAERSIRDFAILNPGAGWQAKQWPAERYGEVARTLAQQGVRPIINFGPGEEKLAEAATDASNGSAETMSFSIGELIALTRRARLFIGGDTGPMHLAAALKVPVVAIFGPTDPTRNGPFATRSIVLRSSTSSTSLSHRSEPDPGILEISAQAVSSAALELLGCARG